MEIIIQEKAMQMLENKLSSEEFLRVTITEGGCAGLTYTAEIDKDMKEGERVVQKSGTVRIVSDNASEPYLKGLAIDYSDDLLAGGLRFANTNAKSTCGCGASFNLSGFPVETGKCDS
jgi:iron-sulfur cluster assembly protein